MFRVLQNPRQDRQGHMDIIQVRDILTPDSKAIISDDLLKLMHRMTKNDIHQTVLMALGYIIQRLEILQETDKKNQAEYAEKLDYFQNLLEEQQERQ